MGTSTWIDQQHWALGKMQAARGSGFDPDLTMQNQSRFHRHSLLTGIDDCIVVHVMDDQSFRESCRNKRLMKMTRCD